MAKFADRFNTKSDHLQNFNYSTPGNYFITICAINKNKFFGKIVNNEIVLSKMGIIANNCLIDISKHFANVCSDAFVVMPNHVHILLRVETPYMASLQDNRQITLVNYSHKNHPDYFPRISQKSKQLIPKIVQQYKSAVTKLINPKTVFFAWQPRYHDIIVKDEFQLIKIKNYIITNPANWQKDKFYN
jgi:REP element-mobilizing transposase RayT